MKRLEVLEERVAGNTHKFIYSVPVTDKKKGETPIYRKPSHKDGLIRIPSNISSLRDIWEMRVKEFGSNKLLEDLTYRQVDQDATKVGSWIVERGHKLFYLYAKNSPQWTTSDIASWMYGLVNVPLYDTLGQEAFDYILTITEGTLLFTTKDLIPSMLKNMGDKKFHLKDICFFDGVDAEDKSKLQKLGFNIFTFCQLNSHAKVHPKPKVTLDSHITYGFTSGTTGIPKGVVYTHRMAAVQVLAMKGQLDYLPTDVHMSFLPVAHTFERFVVWTIINTGGNIKYAKFAVTEIVKDLMTIKPTVIPLVPRLLNKFYPVCKGIYEKEGSYAKVKGMFGGKLRLFVTGSAPVAPTILLFFRQALGCDVREGYGQTETTAASFVTYDGDSNYGHVGGPNSATELKLVDVPEMNYLSTDNPPRGQICTRGQSIFSQYYKDPKNTKETVDADGWNHSGDIGVILPNGALKIVDRKKNIFKIQQGEYIAPEKIENIYARCKYVAQSFLYGDSLKNNTVAIIHPNPDILPLVAKQMGIDETDFKKLCENPKLTQFILDEITKQGKLDGLHSFQMARKIRLWHQPFALVGIVTSTMKLQRHEAKKFFADEIDKLYA